MTENEIVTLLTANDAPLQEACKRGAESLAKLADKAEAAALRTRVAIGGEGGGRLAGVAAMGTAMGVVSSQIAKLAPAAGPAAANIGEMGSAMAAAASTAKLLAGAFKLLVNPVTMTVGAMAGIGAAGKYMMEWSAQIDTVKEKLREVKDKIREVELEAPKIASVIGGKIVIGNEPGMADSFHKQTQAALAKANDEALAAKKALDAEERRSKQLEVERANAIRNTAGDDVHVQEAALKAVEDAQKVNAENLLTARREWAQAQDALAKAAEKEKDAGRAARVQAETEARKKLTDELYAEMKAMEKLADQAGMTDAEKRRDDFRRKGGYAEGDFQLAFFDEQQARIAAVEASAAAAKQAAEADKFLDTLRQEIAAVGASTEELKKNEIARRGLTAAQAEQANALADQLASRQKAQAWLDDAKQRTARIQDEIRTPEERAADEVANLNRLRALNIATGGAQGLSEDQYARARQLAAQRAVQAEGMQPQFRAGLEDIRSLSRRIAASRASGDDPNLKMQERVAKAAEKSAADTAEIKRFTEMTAERLKNLQQGPAQAG